MTKSKTVIRMYGQWAGNPIGFPENPDDCIEEVWNQCGGYVSGQCSRKRGHGPGGLYCRQHGKRAELRASRSKGAK